MSIVMRKQNFYSLINKDGLTGVKEQNGYQVKLDDTTINIYESSYASGIHFVDPDTGLSLYFVQSVGGIEDIEYNLDDFTAKAREMLKKVEKTKEYSIQKKVFRKYKEARLFHERCKTEIQNIQRKSWRA